MWRCGRVHNEGKGRRGGPQEEEGPVDEVEGGHSANLNMNSIMGSGGSPNHYFASPIADTSDADDANGAAGGGPAAAGGPPRNRIPAHRDPRGTGGCWMDEQILRLACFVRRAGGQRV